MAWKRLIFLFLFLSSVSYADEIKLKKIASLNEPWGSTFVNNNELLITEKSGNIKLINLSTQQINKIKHNLNVLEYGQGGLLDIIYKENIVWVSPIQNLDIRLALRALCRGLQEPARACK